MVDIKEYVNKSVKIENMSTMEKIRLSRFNKYVVYLNKQYKENDIYNCFINHYISIGNYGIDCIIIFICLISHNRKILDQNVEVIDDIVTFLYENEIDFYLYEKYLNVCLLNTVKGWLEVFHVLKNTRQFNSEPKILLSVIFISINIDKNNQVLEDEIDDLLGAIYDIFDPIKRERWFDENLEITDFYKVIKSKMDYIQNIMESTYLNIFNDEFESLELMKKINNLDNDTIRIFKEYVLKIDSLEISDIAKVIHILSVVKDFVKEYQGKTKIISFEELKKKHENR